MFRTVAQMHEDLDLVIDKVRTPRFSELQRDRFLNFAMDAIIQDRYNNVKIQKGYSFQAFQRLRDELRTIVVPGTNLTLTSGYYVLPNDYRHSVLLRATVDGVVRAAPPMTYDEQGVIDDDPFDAPDPEFPRHIESENGLEIFAGSGVVSSVELFYVRNPLPIQLATGQDCELPGHLHDEVVMLAGAKVNGSVEDFNKYQVLESEAIKS